MDEHDYSGGVLDSLEPEELGIAPSPPSPGSVGGNVKKPRHTVADAAASSPSAKRSRRSVQKQVVTIPISETKSGAGEGAPPPSDSWAWRKYGQKPIKGSPYPRGYYRCSSSKGCPARKQVERSRVDPSMIVVTYSFDHNHPWPISKNLHHHKSQEAAPTPLEEQTPLPGQEQQPHLLTTESSPVEAANQYEKFSHLVAGDESSLLVSACDFNWFPDVGSPLSPSPVGSDELLYGSAFFGGTAATVATGFPPEEREESASAGRSCEDDALFAELDELPEYSVVCRRGAASAAWMGATTTTG